jgi:hypothetical protein
MPQVGFVPTIPVFERAKTVHALHHAATVIGFIGLLVDMKRRTNIRLTNSSLLIVNRLCVKLWFV